MNYPEDKEITMFAFREGVDCRCGEGDFGAVRLVQLRLT